MKWSAVILGLILGDIIVATSHWFEDSYLPWTDRPGVLGDIARENEMHHAIPYSITSGTLWSNARTSLALTLATGLILTLAFPTWARSNIAFLVTAGVVVSTANILHRFEHERPCRRPYIIQFLQRLGVLCSSEQHSAHHARPREKYGVVFGFTNAVYDTLGLWRFLEAILGFAGFVKTAKKSTDHYKDNVYDDWLTQNMAKPCPDHIPAHKLEQYEDTVRQLVS